MYCCDLSCIYGIDNKLKKKSVGTYALLLKQLQTLFHFYCSIAGAHSLVNLNDLNFKKHSMFGFWFFWVELHLYCSFSIQTGLWIVQILLHFEECLENYQNMYLLSTSVDPVNETLLMSMCSEIAAPAVGP